MSAPPGRPQALHKVLPSAEDLGWHLQAICREVGGDTWFPDAGGSTREAKRICADCPVRLQCLNYALKRNEPFGIWGGLSERERRKVRRGEKVVPTLRPCGTVAAFQRHVRDGEAPCDECRAAKNDASRQWARSQARQRFRARSLGETA